MKRAATQGTWKTPPNLVYAKDSSNHSTTTNNSNPPAPAVAVAPPPPAPAAAAASSSSASSGTKMQLMGLPFTRKSILPNLAPTKFFSTPAPPLASAAAAVVIVPQHPAPAPQFQPPPMMQPPVQFAPPPPAELSLAAPVVVKPEPAVVVATAPTTKPRKTTKREAAAPAAASAAAASAPATSDAPPSKEDKQKMLEHSRTMARLRRQQQRALTDSLESEFFELSATAAYLRALLASEDCSQPLAKQDRDRIVHEAFEHAVTQLTPHIPSARSQEMKNVVQSVQRMMQQEDHNNSNAAHHGGVPPLVQVPLPHQIHQLTNLDERMGTFLAVTQGSRKESFSFSLDRKRSALLFALDETKSLFNAMLEEEALPLVASLNSLDFSEREMVPGLLGVIRHMLAVKRASEWLLSPALLSLPKTDSLIEQFRDTCNSEQTNKLLNWTVINESQIAQLKFSSTSASQRV